MFSNPRAKVTSTLGLIVVDDEQEDAVDLVLFDRKKLERYLARKKAPTDAEFQKEAMAIMVGLIRLEESWRCRGAYEVKSSAARKGYGPMLYDAAMEVARKRKRPGVIPDRSEVSPAASRLWHFAQTKRSDVKADRTGLFCPEHGDTGRPELDAVYSLKKPFPGYAKLIKQGQESFAKAQKKFGVPKSDTLILMDMLRGIFWNCYYHGKCPAGVKRQPAAGAPNPRR